MVNVTPKQLGKNVRMSFGKITEPLEMPNLIEVQKNSYKWFREEGLREVFRDMTAITDYNGNLVLNFKDYRFETTPKYTLAECKARGATYQVAMKATATLCNKETGAVSESEIYMGDFPLMTESGTFVINGAERVVVSQLVRSPGVYYAFEKDKTGKDLFSTTVIPNRGAWLEYEMDSNDVVYVRIDKNRKIPITTFIRALGVGSDEEIYELFGPDERLKQTILQKDGTKNNSDALIDVYKKLRPGEPPTVDSALAHLNNLFFDARRYDLCRFGRYKYNKKLGIASRLSGRVLTQPIINPITGEIMADAGETISVDKAHEIEQAGVYYAFVKVEAKEYVTNDRGETTIKFVEREAKVIGNGMVDISGYVDFDAEKYGINEKVSFKVLKDILENSADADEIEENVKKRADELVPKHIILDDIFASISYFINLCEGVGIVDDIDHLGNRRIRSVGELLQNQFRIGYSRMERSIRERMNLQTQDINTLTPSSLINIRPISSAMREFFASSPLSQFMDQNNPLAELTHKRRLSALGPGGLSRDRAGFEVRDVHYSHYGRMCPIETPEGPNIGLISSLCVYAKINDLGFIETPYREVKDGVVNLKNDEVVYLTAEIEEGKIIAQGNAPVKADGEFVNDRVKARLDADFPIVAPDQVELMDVSPTQIASIAASLIPFLEHDDANRALMGSNMMRQAVPLLRSEAPIVGTGIEGQLIHDSRTQIMAEGEGVIEFVDATVIRIRYDRTEDEEFVSFEDSVKEYHLPKFRKTNQSTTIDLRPICNKGQRVKAGDILTEGYSTENGELALGRNLKVAFMPWKGYNYEDAIVLNERVVREDILTSVHVDEYTLEVRETKRGMEELTSDIPNVSEDATKDLDDRGIIRVGAHIVPGDIMIGKITPKGESDPTPEEKLLRAIFGDKAGDVKDASLKASPSLKGVVIGTHLFQKAEKKKTKKSASAVLPMLDEKYEERLNDLKDLLVQKLMTLTEGKTSQGVKDFLGSDIIPKGAKFSAGTLKEIDYDTINLSKWTADAHKNDMIRATIVNYLRKSKEIDAELRRKKFDISIGDELPSGIMKLAKVYIAKKRKISVGDKMAGRHGNKGIVSRIVRQEDMPFLADGTPVDIVLNPLGVPSRMNLGQIFETVLGWAGRELGEKFATPIFDGATLENLNEWTDKAGLPRYGKTYLYDGGTGERFDQPATVGVIYMLKLGHMVEDKMHARSIGPYSLITQQPLGGKAQFGGQRFGEMEVWALEAYGASYTLQEILTVKSDDVVGRVKTYEAIIKGDNIPEPGIPESFKVLLKELQSLGLDVKVLDDDRNEVELVETSEYGNTDLNAIIAGDKDYAFEDSESFGKMGFTKQEFDTENEELVDIEDDLEEELGEELEEDLEVDISEADDVFGTIDFTEGVLSED